MKKLYAHLTQQKLLVFFMFYFKNTCVLLYVTTYSYVDLMKIKCKRDCRGRDRMVVGFTKINPISA